MVIQRDVALLQEIGTCWSEDESTQRRISKSRSRERNDGCDDVDEDEDDANPTNQLFIEACEKLGFRRTTDYNAEASLIGCVVMSKVSAKGGTRCSTASGYLLSAGKRKNLDILIHVHTCRVAFDDEKNATGRFFAMRSDDPDPFSSPCQVSLTDEIVRLTKKNWSKAKKSFFPLGR